MSKWFKQGLQFFNSFINIWEKYYQSHCWKNLDANHICLKVNKAVLGSSLDPLKDTSHCKAPSEAVLCYEEPRHQRERSFSALTTGGSYSLTYGTTGLSCSESCLPGAQGSAKWPRRTAKAANGHPGVMPLLRAGSHHPGGVGAFFMAACKHRGSFP